MSHQKKYLLTGSILLLLAVAIGAFGAHALKDIVTGKYLVTFKTGGQYHFYHAFALLVLGLIKSQYKDLNLNLIYNSFLGGIILFSFNCYLYAITQSKVFAMVVPIGGVLFMVGWASLSYKIYRNTK
jgi:uncharacterized membrane protein YgdD (TMEM256/DUF423 family)